jgi:uncharacterized membrane protein YphA (DoxX/SURF4 family)
MVLVRLATGTALCAAGWQKLLTGAGPYIVERTAERIAEAPTAFAWWGREVLLRSPETFALVFSWGAFAAGVLLILGALVRPASALAVVLLANVYFAGPVQQRELVALLAVCALACAQARAGRRIGLDEWLDPRLPRWLTWAR